MMSDTYEPERKYSASLASAKLLRMLRSTLRNSRTPPHLEVTPGGFGASLDDGSYLRIVYSGRWTAEAATISCYSQLGW